MIYLYLCRYASKNYTFGKLIDEHLIEKVHLKPIVLSDVCNLHQYENLYIIDDVHLIQISFSCGGGGVHFIE